ncbi:MAG: alpha/beta hydrolase [Fimbriimonadaceae bacterium]
MSRRVTTLLIVLAALAVLATAAWKIARRAEARADTAYLNGVLEIPFATTRGHVANGEITEGHDRFGYEVSGSVPGINGPIAEDIFVVVHGLNNTETKGVNRFGLARESLQYNGYEGEVIGFSWDGATNWDPFGATGYRTAKHNAMANGPKLAQFLTDLQSANPNARVRLIGYSMGARLVAEAVWTLDNDERFKDDEWKIASVHLVGAAIDDEHLQTDDRYGTAIERRVGRFFNYYSPVDSKLGKYFPPLEADRAVGRHDLEDPSKAPKNYVSHDVTDELLTADEEGDVDSNGERGRNHSSYLGIRRDDGKWVDDGCMDVVAKDIAR